MNEELDNRWLPLREQVRRDSPGALPLFCLPHAGGGASAYRPWVHKLPGVAVLPVQPPGREARFRDETITRMPLLVAELAPVVLAEAGDRPYAVYGHSVGALVAFELVREIRRLGGMAPVQLLLSGSVAPQYSAVDGPRVLGMSRDELVDLLRALGGTPDWLLADSGAVDMILPAVRADLAVKETYRFRAEPPLEVPITVLASTDDPRAAEDLQQGWRAHTAGRFELHTLTGGHFAVFEQASMTYEYILAALRSWLSGQRMSAAR